MNIKGDMSIYMKKIKVLELIFCVSGDLKLMLHCCAMNCGGPNWTDTRPLVVFIYPFED